MRVFLDATILFSAAESDGAVRTLPRLLAKGPQALHALDALLPDLRLPAADVEWLPEKARPVLAAAIRSRCDALVTGDRTHFGRGYGRVCGGVMIHSPRSLAERLFA